MNAMLLKMPRTRKRRTSFAMNVRSTIVEARYPAKSVIVVMPRNLSSATAVGQLCNDQGLIAPIGIAGMSRVSDLVSLVSRRLVADSVAALIGRLVMEGEFAGWLALAETKSA
jgi:hypothetical protein